MVREEQWLRAQVPDPSFAQGDFNDEQWGSESVRARLMMDEGIFR